MIAITDVSGRCVVSLDAPLIVTATGFVTALAPPRMHGARDHGGVETIVLRRGIVIAGIVVDPVGTPIPGVSVVVDFGGMHGCEARAVRSGSSLAWMSADGNALGQVFETTTGSDGVFRFADVPAGQPTLSVRRYGYVQTWKDEANRLVTSPFPMHVASGATDVFLTVTMDPLYVAVIAGIVENTPPADYCGGGMTVSWDIPDSARGLRPSSVEDRLATSRIRDAMRRADERLSVQCSIVAFRSVVDRAQLTRQAAVYSFGASVGVESVTYSALANWSTDACTMVELGSAPTPCEVIVESAFTPRINTSSGAIHAPLSSTGNSHRFLVPPGAGTVTPSLGLLSNALRRLAFDAQAGGSVRLVVDWSVSSIRLTCLSRTGHVTTQGLAEIVSSAGIGRNGLSCPIRLPAVPVEPGDYEVRLRDPSGRVVDAKQVAVAAGSSVDVVLRHP
jgi:hypothetical protein